MNKVRYIQLDWQRRAEFLGMEHKWPSPDPIVQDLETLKISDDQPYIYRLTYLGVEAERKGKGIEFAAEVSKLIFGGTKDWHQDLHLAEAAKRVELDLASRDKAIINADHAQEVSNNQQALDNVGHWGVPTFVVEGEPFFGQDRIDTLRWRLGQLGLEK
jgi:2-hydroxychromene-2-carboxylate isomerase